MSQMRRLRDQILPVMDHRANSESITSTSMMAMCWEPLWPGKNHCIPPINRRAHTRGTVEGQINHNMSAVCVYICRVGRPGPDSHGNRWTREEREATGEAGMRVGEGGWEKIGKESRLSPVIRGGGIPVWRGRGPGGWEKFIDKKGERGDGETMFGIEREQTIICID